MEGTPGVAEGAEVRGGALTGLRRAFSSCLPSAVPVLHLRPTGAHPGLPWVGSSQGPPGAWL